MTQAALERISAELAGEGGLLEASLRPGGPQLADGDPRLGELAASGPLAARDTDRVALAVEAAYEGHLLHRGRSRVLDTTDLDLALLAGDRLYALSLATLAEAGAVEAVAELADVISLCAQAQAAGDERLESAAWEAGASAIGWGSGPGLEAAKRVARAGGGEAASALATAARQARAASRG
jgi:hypothetical protein